MTTLYALLNRDAKAWWYHKQLRERGQTEEARKRERDSIKSDVDTLRKCIADGGYASIGRGGWGIHYHNGTLSGYGGIDSPEMQACLMLGIPIVNTRDADISVAYLACKMPIIAVGKAPDAPPWHGMSYAPLDYVFGKLSEAGALVYNWPKH
jgi:hypothetical protein